MAVDSCYAQVLWMKQMLLDNEIKQEKMILMCDNICVINIAKNPIQHSRTKHIDIRHDFIKELVEYGVIILKHIETRNQFTDILTKAVNGPRFKLEEILVCVFFPK